jgi:hypothetical protein
VGQFASEHDRPWLFSCQPSTMTMLADCRVLFCPVGCKRLPPVLSSLSVSSQAADMSLTPQHFTDVTCLILPTIRLLSGACCLHRRVTMFITALTSVRTVAPFLPSFNRSQFVRCSKFNKKPEVKSVHSSHQTDNISTSHAKNTTALQPNAF